MTRHKLQAGLFFGLMMFMAAPAASAEIRYTVTDLGNLGVPFATGFGVNEYGRTVGFSALQSAHFRGFFATPSMYQIDPVGGDAESVAFGLTDDDVAFGTSYSFGDLVQHAFRWDGTTESLGDFAPRAGNNDGTLVGSVAIQSGGLWYTHACRFSNGVVEDLGTLGGGNAEAFGIDAAGWIVGQSQISGDGKVRAFLRTSSKLLDLGTLGGTNSTAQAINSTGEIAGTADTTAGKPHAFVFKTDSNGSVTQRIDLGELGGGYSYAYAINDAGVVVGTSDSFAFVADSGGMNNLNALVDANAGWRLEIAWGINSAGQIVGVGQHHGQYAAFLLTPTSCAGFTTCDANCDGNVDFNDIDAFVAALISVEEWMQEVGPCNFQCVNDTNRDGSVDFNDIDSFVECMIAP